MSNELIHCGCGRMTGQCCAWSGPLDDTVIVEWMPEHLRASHVAAGNNGTYPANGAERIRTHWECASMIVEADPEWAKEIDVGSQEVIAVCTDPPGGRAKMSVPAVIDTPIAELAAWARGVVGPTPDRFVALDAAQLAARELEVIARFFPGSTLRIGAVDRTSVDGPINSGSDKHRARFLAHVVRLVQRVAALFGV